MKRAQRKKSVVGRSEQQTLNQAGMGREGTSEEGTNEEAELSVEDSRSELSTPPSCFLTRINAKKTSIHPWS